MRLTPSFAHIAARPSLALLVLLAPTIASAQPLYPEDTFTLRTDASGVIWREDMPSTPVLAQEPPALQAVERRPECMLPSGAISSSDSIENFTPANGRFSKVPKYLVPFYEQACEDFDIPVRYLAADGSYETHFNARKIGDRGRSCGIHQFNEQGKRNWPRNWGFRDLEHCFDPEANIRKTAEFWRSMMNTKRVCSGDIACAVRRHNGAQSYGYMRAVMSAADRYYR